MEGKDMQKSVFEDTQQVSTGDGMTLYFFVYIFDLKINVKQHLVEINEPRIMNPPYYPIQKSSFNNNIYTCEINIPKQVKHVIYRIVLDTFEGELRTDKETIYSGNLYSQIKISEQKEIYIFNSVTSLLHKDEKIPEMRLSDRKDPFTPLACALIEHMYSPNKQTKLVNVEKQILERKKREINFVEVFRTCYNLYCKRKDEGVEHIWLYIFEILYLIKNNSDSSFSKCQGLQLLSKSYINHDCGFLKKYLLKMSDAKYQKFVDAMQLMISAYPLLGVQYMLETMIVTDSDVVFKRIKESQDHIYYQLTYLRVSISHLIKILEDQREEDVRMKKKTFRNQHHDFLMVQKLISFAFSICVHFDEIIATLSQFDQQLIKQEDVVAAFNRVNQIQQAQSRPSPIDSSINISDKIKSDIENQLLRCLQIELVLLKFKPYLQIIISEHIAKARNFKPLMTFDQIYDDILVKYPTLLTREFLIYVCSKNLFKKLVDCMPSLIIVSISHPNQFSKDDLTKILSLLFKWDIGQARTLQEKIEVVRKYIQISKLELTSYRDAAAVHSQSCKEFETLFLEIANGETNKTLLDTIIPVIIAEDRLAPKQNEVLIKIISGALLKRIQNTKVSFTDAQLDVFITEFVDENMALKSAYLQPCLEEIVLKISQKYPNIDTGVIFDTPIMFKLLQIKQDGAPIEFIKALKTKGKDFYKLTKDLQLQVREITRFYSKIALGYVDKVLSMTVGEAYDPEYLKDAVQKYDRIFSDLHTFKIFYEWARKLGQSLEADLIERKTDMSKYEGELPELFIGQAATQERLSFMMNKKNATTLTSLESYKGFNKSKIMRNIFDFHRGRVFSEVKTVDEFDHVSSTYLFDIVAREYFQKMLLEQTPTLTYEQIDIALNQVNAENLPDEILMIKEFFQHILQTRIDDKIQREKLDYLKSFCQISSCLSICNQFLQLEYLYDVRGDVAEEENKKDDSYLRQFKNFRDFTDSMKQTNPTMRQIHSQISQFTSFIQNDVGVRYHVDISTLQVFAKSAETFAFCVAKGDTDFNDLNQLDDSQQFIDYQLINHMNMVRSFFISLAKDIVAVRREPSFSFMGVCQLLHKSLEDQKQKHMLFEVLLQDCNDAIDRFRSWYQTQMNTDDNTMQVVNETIIKGRIIWERENLSDRFRLKIEIPSYPNEPLVNEKLNQHCGRALLMVNPNTDEDKEEKEKEDNINTFLAIVRLSQEIRDIHTSLLHYGHNDYARQGTPQSHQLFLVEEGNVVARLKEKKQTEEMLLQKWRECLLSARMKFYCMTFIPNQMMPDIIDFLEDPSEKSFLPIQYILMSINKKITYRRLKEDTQIRKSQANCSIELKMASYFANLQELIDVLSTCNPVDEAFDESQENRGQDQLRSGFYRVENEGDMMREIVSLFYVTNQMPQSYQVMFCESSTHLQDVEIFVLRAILNKKQELFVLANFQNLPLFIQLESQKLIETYSKDLCSSSHKFLLYILFYKQNNRDGNLIEELLRAPKLNCGFTHSDFKYKILSKFISPRKTIRVVSASSSGLGKTTLIYEQIKKREMKYIRIPIYGDVTRQKLAERHKEEFKSVQYQQFSKLGFHYDIYHGVNGSDSTSKKESLNTLLFDILILGAINKSAGCLFYFDKEAHFYLEISDSLNHLLQQGSALFLNMFPKTHIQWKDDEFQICETDEERKTGGISIQQDIKRYVNKTTIKVNERTDSDVQLVCRYLEFRKIKAEYTQEKVHYLQNPRSPLDSVKCQNLLSEFFLDGIENQNYYILNSYLTLIAEQIKRMHQSIFFKHDNFFEQYRKPKDADMVYRDIVNSFFKLGDKLTKTERCKQDQIRSSEAILSNADEVVRRQVEKLDKLRWSSEIYWVLFNDSSSITPIFSEKTEIAPGILKHFEKNPLKSFSQMKQTDFHEKILEMCVDTRDKRRIEEAVDMNQLQFTKDNFVKLALIYFRLISRQPVILMGETGVGKTSLVNFLSQILDSKFQKLFLHAGVEEKHIISFVKDTIEIAQQNRNCNVIMFLDEINTNEHISGLLKEIIIDRHLLGLPLPFNISIVAACNPYKLKQYDHQEQVDEGVSHDKHKQKKQSKLVYQVYPLPESMFSYIWDYGSLPKDEEKEYIKKIIEKLNSYKYSLTDNNKLNDNECDVISSILSQAQSFTKQHEAEWAVSLRDISRFTQLFDYFSNNNIRKSEEYRARFDPKDTDKKRALILSLSFCYYFRIKSILNRNTFLKKLELDLLKFGIDLDFFKNVLDQEQMRFINEMEIPRGIGLNSLLKENIFAMIICILNKIPLFIIGKPGSSKSLAMNLVSKSFKGHCSKSKLFKSFPSIFSMMYQGSEQSTSNGIRKVFENAIKKQEYFDIPRNKVEQEMLALVIIEEIGLAEISPHNPLKVLHEILEPPKVPTIGISNWTLDASKMNRAITLQRPDPNEDDLYESARKIAEDINQENPAKQEIFTGQYLNWLIKGYLKTFNMIRPALFGLRDFYCMVKHINRGLSTDGPNYVEGNNQLCIRAIQRNFGGDADPRRVIGLFESAARESRIENIFDFESDSNIFQDLIKENLQDDKSRNLLISTDCFGKTIAFIQKVCRPRECQVFYGSDFVEDTVEEAAYKLIKEIVLCMERGLFCVLLNLESIYQSFYDMLNQNYQEIEGKLYCKIAIGSDSKIKPVHRDFKCVLLIERDRLQELDLPLLNRFEKQIFTDDLILTQEQRQVNHALECWIRDVSYIGSFKSEDTFPMYAEEDLSLVQGLIISNTYYKGVKRELEEIIYECKRDMMQMASFAGVIRMKKAKAADKDQWVDFYMTNDVHLSLAHLLDRQLCNWQDDHKFFMQNGQNLIINYYSAMTSNIGEALTQKGFKVHGVLQLNEMLSKDKFELKLSKFLNQSRDNLLLIFVNPLVDSQRRLDLVISLINKQRNKQLDLDRTNARHICLLIRFEPQTYRLYFNEGWRVFTLDFLSYENETGMTLDKVLNGSFMEILKEEQFFYSLVKDRITTSFSMIQYNRCEDWLKKRLFKVRVVFSDEDMLQHIMTLIVQLVISHYQYDEVNWLNQVVNDPNLMVKQTILEASSEYFKNIVEKYLTTTIFNFESIGLIQGLANNQYKPTCLRLLPQAIHQLLVHRQPREQYVLGIEQSKSHYPFSQVIHEEFLKLKDNYMHELVELATKYNPEDKEDEEQKTEQEEIDNDVILQSKIQTDVAKSIQNLEDRFLAIIPDYMTAVEGVEILSILPTSVFLKDFCIIQQSTNLDKKVYYFLMKVIEILMKGQIVSVPYIYGVYWRMEEQIQQAISFLNASVYSCTSKNYVKDQITQILEAQFESLQEKSDYKPYIDLKLTQRDIFVDCLIHLFEDLFYPTASKVQDQLDPASNLLWEVQAKNALSILKPLSGDFLRRYCLELPQIELLIDFKTKVLVPLQVHQNQLIVFGDLLREGQIIKIFKFIDNLVIDSKRNPESRELLSQFQNQAIKFFFDNRQFLDNDQKRDYFKLLLEKSASKFWKPKHLTGLSPEQFIRQCRIISYIVTLIQDDTPEDEESVFMKVNQNVLDLQVNGSPLFQDLLIWEQTLKTKYTKKDKITDESPFIVALCDAIEDTLPEIDGENVSKCLPQVLEDCLSSKASTIKKVMSIAYYRKLIKQFVKDIDLTLGDDDHQFSHYEAKDILESFFQRKSNSEALIIYTLKVIKQELDMFQFDGAKDYASWIENYRGQMVQNQVGYPITLNSKIDEKKQLLKLDSQSDVFFNLKKQMTNVDAKEEDKFFIGTMILQYFYLNSNKSYFKDEIEQDLKASKHLGDSLIKYLSTLCSEETQGIQQRTFLLKEDEQERQIQIFLSYFGVACFSANMNSFLRRVAESPELIQEVYVPFLANVKEDYYYHVHLEMGGFKRYRCKSCKSIFVITDCGDISNHRSKDQNVNLGGMNCLQCDKPVGSGAKQNSELIEDKKLTKKNFSTDKEGKKSYINLNPGEIGEINLRKIKRKTLLVGNLIVHSLLLIGFLQSDRQEEFIQEYFKTQPRRIVVESSADKKTIVKELMQHIFADWKEISKVMSNHNKGVQILLEDITCQLITMSNDASFSFDSLKTSDGRIKFEQLFEKLVTKDNDYILKLLNMNISRLDETGHQLVEHSKSSQRVSLLRIQKSIDLKCFLMYVQQQDDPQSKALQNMIRFKDDLSKIECLQPLLNWAHLVFQLWDNKITYEQSYDLSIREMIKQISVRNYEQSVGMIFEQIEDMLKSHFGDSSLNELGSAFKVQLQSTLSSGLSSEELGLTLMKQIREEYKVDDDSDRLLANMVEGIIEKQSSSNQTNFVLKKYREFEKAWNKFAGRTFDDVCDHVVLTQISLDSKFQYCCLTKKQDSLGYQFYLLLDYIAQLQNEFLLAIQRERVSTREHPQVKLMELNKQQIIQQGISAEDQEEIIKDGNSFTALEYGRGTNVLFDLTSILERFEDFLLSGKAIINMDADIKFTFTNVGNQFTEFDEIQQKITPQKRNAIAYDIVAAISEQGRHQLYNDDLRTTINLLKQTGGKPSQPLIEYMKAFNLNRFEKEILPDIKLSHFLHFYETVEGSCSEILTQRTDKKYQKELQVLEKEQLDDITSKNFMKEGNLDNEEDLMHIKRAIERLCIRQLSYNQQLSDKEKLFPYMFNCINTYLFDVDSKPNTALWIGLFHSCKDVLLAHSYAVWQLFCEYEEQIKLRRSAANARQQALKPQSPDSDDGSDDSGFDPFGSKMRLYSESKPKAKKEEEKKAPPKVVNQKKPDPKKKIMKKGGPV